MDARNVLLIFLWLSLGMNVSWSQNQDEVFFWKQELSVKQNDTSGLSLALKIAEFYKNNNPDSLMKYSKWVIDHLGDYPLPIHFKKMAEAHYDWAIAMDRKSSFNEAIEAADMAINFYREGKDRLGMISSRVLKAWILYNKGEVVSAIELAQETLSALLELESEWSGNQRFQKILGNVNSDLGTYYKRVGESDKAVEFSEKSLLIRKKLGDRDDLAEAIMNLGRIFHDLKNFDEALSKYNESLAIVQETMNISACSFIYSNRGQLYYDTKKWDLAEIDFTNSLELRTQLSDTKGKANIQRKLAEMFLEKGDLDKSQDFFNGAELEYRKINYKVGLSQTLIGEAKLRLIQKDSLQSLQLADEAYQISRDANSIKVLLKCAEFIQPLYKYYGKISEALMAAEDAQRAQAQIKEEEAKEMLIQQAYQEKQASSKRYIYLLISGAVILLVILVLIFRAYKLKQRASKLIEKEKEWVEERNKNMMDSIQYAQQLQQAILPPMENIQKSFLDSFLIYWPKDIVAGDFYWLHEDEEYKLWAVADCTGHGVPGAMVSVVCSNALNRVVKETSVRQSNQILNEVRRLVIETFKESQREVKDGMDIGLCVLNKTTGKIQFSGANRPLWWIKTNGQLEEIKGDKQHIGFQQNMKLFAVHELSVERGDAIYMMTDGFVDQFGGPQGKKYMTSRFKTKLMEIAGQPFDLQRMNLEWEFNQWKGNQEQIDDVCILGIKCS